MQKIFIHHIVFRLVAPLFVGLIAYLFVLLFFDSIDQLTSVFFSSEALVSIGQAYIQYELIRLGIRLIERKFPNPDSLLRVAIQIGLSLLISILVISSSLFLYFKFALDMSPRQTELTVINLAFGLITIGYNLLYFNVYFLNRENEKRLSQENLMKKNLEYELDAFKGQINPHFLYESLESLLGLIHISPTQSEDLIDQLASTYRYTLNSQKEEFVSIKQEIKALKNFIAVLNTKYHNLISLDLSTSQCEEDKPIIPNTLHWLVQYVVSNTLIHETKPLNLKIYCEHEGYIILESDLSPKLKLPKNAKAGFEKAQRAYLFFTDTPIVQVGVEGKQFIKIPPLHNTLEEREALPTLEQTEKIES